MKYQHILTSLLILFIFACGSDPKSKPKSVSTLSTFMDSTSYSLGADLGENLKRQQVEIDYDVFMAGLMDGMETEMVKLDQGQRRAVMASLQKNIREKSKKEGEANLKLADEFLQLETHAPHPMQAAALNASIALSFSIGMAFPSGALPVLTETYPPACIILSKEERSVTRSFKTGKEEALHGSTVIVSPLLKLNMCN